MNVSQDVWNKVLSLMEKDMTPTSINTWFDDIEAISIENDRFVLYSPNKWKRDIITSRYLKIIESALEELFSSKFAVIVLSEGELDVVKRESDFLPGTEGFTFDNFVVGESNKFAHAAALSVANMPGGSYNPLLIYGQSGLGKTHLLYAIAHKMHENNPSANICYIKGETFVNELIRALQTKTTAEFKDKYRSVDLLLVDDVQFIAGKDSTQEEFFHTFNALYEENKQIVLTSDRPPKEMSRLEERLRTRFEWGLLADIQPPDYETRVAIIKNKAISMGMELPNEVLSYIAENITANVRQIEGTINKLLAFKELMGDEVDSDSVIRAVRDIFKDTSDILPTPDLIIEEVCNFYRIDDATIKGNSRDKTTVVARQVAAYLIRSKTNLTTSQIGKIFGKDHATIIHAVTKITDQLKTDAYLAEVIKDINTNINAHF